MHRDLNDRWSHSTHQGGLTNSQNERRGLMPLHPLNPSQLPSKELVTRMQMAKEMKQMKMNKKKG
jgi:hypothetical protein